MGKDPSNTNCVVSTTSSGTHTTTNTAVLTSLQSHRHQQHRQKLKTHYHRHQLIYLLYTTKWVYQKKTDLNVEIYIPLQKQDKHCIAIPAAINIKSCWKKVEEKRKKKRRKVKRVRDYRDSLVRKMERKKEERKNKSRNKWEMPTRVTFKCTSFSSKSEPTNWYNFIVKDTCILCRLFS